MERVELSSTTRAGFLAQAVNLFALRRRDQEVRDACGKNKAAYTWQALGRDFKDGASHGSPCGPISGSKMIC